MPIIKDLPIVPAERTLKVIGGRWKVFVLYFLFQGPKRLSELRRFIPNVSQKVLVQSLRELEQHGIIDREVFAEVPPRVVYTATKLGLSLGPIVGSLCDWGRKHAEAIDAVSSRQGPSAKPVGSSPVRRPRATAVRRRASA